MTSAKDRQRLTRTGERIRMISGEDQAFNLQRARLGSQMNFLQLLEAKRDGITLLSEDIERWVHAVVAGEIPDYQIAAFLMAVYFRGMTEGETRALTMAMRDSGDRLDFPEDKRLLVDKHSTGGVGDKVSLPLAPLLACLGFRVPMIAGRGLGITGGTLDKLESIPGFRTVLDREQIVAQVQSLGCCICAQTDRMVPADRILYALRDVTATVPSIPLITASILSKKLAESLDSLVLNVTTGRAAFMADRSAAMELASRMVSLANACGVRTNAVVTQMDSPLGTSIGNWVEVRESEACLLGRGPEDVRSLVLEFAGVLLLQTGRARTIESGRAQAEAELDSGRPWTTWRELLRLQGADLEAYEHRLRHDTLAAVVRDVRSDSGGYVRDSDARVLGEVVRDLGGGRFRKGDQPHLEVGLDAIAAPGALVDKQGLLARVHAQDAMSAAAAVERVRQAFVFSDEPVLREPLLLKRLGPEFPR